MPRQTLTPERAELAALHVPVADKAVTVFLRRKHIPLRKAGIERDDLIQVAREALCHAAVDWKPGAGRFPSFAFQRCWFRLIDWLRADGPFTRYGVRKLNTIAWQNDDGGDWYADHAPPTEVLLRDDQLVQDHADVVVAREWFAECMRLVSAREEYVLRSMFVDGRTGASLAKEMGVSQGRVSQMTSNAMGKIRRGYVNGDV